MKYDPYEAESARSAVAIDFKSLKKLESLTASAQAEPRSDDDRLVVLVKLREGATHPSYISPRARISSKIFSAEIRAGELARIETDPTIESVSISHRLPLIT
jgi:hypothetical protein